MIEAKNVSLVYGDGTEALKDVNLKIDKGDIVYITGHSGSERQVCLNSSWVLNIQKGGIGT